MKACKTCGVVKPLEEFPQHKDYLDGTRSDCRLCYKKYLFEWRRKNQESAWERDKKYAARPDIRAKTYERNALWRQKNSAKTKCHYVFHRALKAGRIQPSPCWVCGEKAEAHHPDYSSPLDVVWLCKSHHKQTHALVQGDTNAHR